MKVEFHPEASAEFQAASAYYEKEVPGLGEAFISQVERVAELIGVHPAIGNPIDEIFGYIRISQSVNCIDIAVS
jgi:plasmid stabilization system protein ParE